MQYFIGFLATVLVPLIPSIAKGLATYVALSVGFSLVAYTGVSVAMDSIADYIQSNMNGVTPKLAALMAMAGVDTYINVVLTCVAFLFTLNGLMSATGYRPSWRKPVDPA